MSDSPPPSGSSIDQARPNAPDDRAGNKADGHSEYGEILYQVEDPVAVITLNRPKAMNAWTPTMDAALRHALTRAANDRRVFGIIVTGAGRAFCAGADMGTLDALSSGGAADIAADPADGDGDGDGVHRSDFDGRLMYPMALDKPVIAAVNGAVAGMAYPFALACDLRVVSPEALFVTSFAERGLIAEWGLSWLLPRLVGPAVALDLLMSSRRVMGPEAVRLGLANTLVEADQLLDHCKGYIGRMAERCSPTSIAVMKRQVYQQLHQGLGQAERQSQALMMESFNRPDFAEGVTSFLEKRPPRFERLPLPEA